MSFDIVPIDHPDDPRIEPFRAVRERDLVGRRGLFIAEGEVVLRHLAVTPLHEPVAYLCAGDRLAKMRALLEGTAGGAPVHVASQAVMDAIVGFPIHRGLLGLGRRRDLAACDLLAGLPRRATVVGLHGVANHDNMGGLFRNAAAFGADAVVLDATCCDPLYRKALRVSVGAGLVVPFARLEPGEDMVDVLTAAGFQPAALSPSGATALLDWAPGPRPALIFGAEGPGLPDAVLARCETLAIPMAAGFDSLNVATTSGIVLHHLTATHRRIQGGRDR